MGFLAGLLHAMKKPKSYKKYLDQADKHNASIMAKYGAPPEARPPMERDVIPAPSDRQYRRYAFIKRRSLEYWPKNERSKF